MSRQRMRPTRRRNSPSNPETRAARVTPTRPQWRETLDAWGGFWTLGIVLGSVLLVGGLIFTNARSQSSNAVSTAPLMGEEMTSTGAGKHVTTEAELVISAGKPPVSGPHFATPQAPAAYAAPIPDGQAIHSLEHGIIWFTYNPEKLDAAGIQKLRDLQSKYSRDVILSPRPQNAAAAASASWGRLLQQDAIDTGALEAFIKTNRNRSPEPGVR